MVAGFSCISFHTVWLFSVNVLIFVLLDGLCLSSEIVAYDGAGRKPKNTSLFQIFRSISMRPFSMMEPPYPLPAGEIMSNLPLNKYSRGEITRCKVVQNLCHGLVFPIHKAVLSDDNFHFAPNPLG